MQLAAGYVNWADLVNGSFEILGAVALWGNVRALLRDKKIAGVDWRAVAFFQAWGLWNLYYYPSLDQWASFVGGLAICAVNTIWLSLVFYYYRGRKTNT